MDGYCEYWNARTTSIRERQRYFQYIYEAMTYGVVLMLENYNA